MNVITTTTPPLDLEAAPKQPSQATIGFVQGLRKEYEETMAAIDSEVPRLIRTGEEMRALMLLTEKANAIFDLHKTLSTYYGVIIRHKEILRRFQSERLRQFGGEPIPTWELLKELSSDREGWECLRDTIATFQRANFFKTHWAFPDPVLTEVEYMLDAMAVLVEPDFSPIPRDNTADSQGEVNRYIPADVKLAVWRRDQGKCVECGSQERLEYDHVIPVSRGGSNTERNIQLLCEQCNRKKAAAIA